MVPTWRRRVPLRLRAIAGVVGGPLFPQGLRGDQAAGLGAKIEQQAKDRNLARLQTGLRNGQYQREETRGRRRPRGIGH